MNGSTSRDRSPLRHPAAANMGFAPSPNLHPTFNPHNSTSFDQPIFDQALAQQLNDPAFSAFANSSSSFDPTLTNLPDQDHLSPHSLSNHTSPAPQDNLNFPTFEFNPDSTLVDLDLLQQQNNLNGGHITLNTMSAVSHSPTPPHLLGRNSNSPSPAASPNNPHAPFMGRPRNTSESLDPSSAAFPNRSSGDWTNMSAFRGHRRVHSDNLSDISSHSNQASPYLATLESFDSASHASPLLNASQDPMLGDALGIGQFNLNDHVGGQPNFRSPGHSPHISPRLVPQQPLPAFTPADNFGLNLNMNDQMFTNQPYNDLGPQDHMSPPEINIDFAPNQRPFNAPPVNAPMDNSLTPPLKGSRIRAKSASYVDSRPVTPSVPGRGRSPSLQPGLEVPFGSTSNPSSRNSSPRGRASSLSNRGRSTSAASDQREYILILADPDRSPSNGGDNRRAQKHPATFSCHLCPKRFTRAYNLRSHLRTHTDERPFVCTVCGKAFARQHDRKRHEGLHSGEKKFVCRGPLKNGEQWGCNRRFARADALGRHFRSEAGRICIRPLLEEEAAEQQAANNANWIEQQNAGFGQQPPPVDYSASNFLPARLLEQFPALAGIDWATAAAQGAGDDDGYNGRSSFDAGSGGEMYDDLSEGEFVDPGAAMGFGMPAQNFGVQQPAQQNRNSMQRQPMMSGFGSHQMGDYTNGFEGR